MIFMWYFRNVRIIFLFWFSRYFLSLSIFCCAECFDVFYKWKICCFNRNGDGGTLFCTHLLRSTSFQACVLPFWTIMEAKTCATSTEPLTWRTAKKFFRNWKPHSTRMFLVYGQRTKAKTVPTILWLKLRLSWMNGSIVYVLFWGWRKMVSFFSYFISSFLASLF